MRGGWLVIHGILFCALLAQPFDASGQTTRQRERPSDPPLPARYETVTDAPRINTDPCVSPDGVWLAFASDRLGNFDIYTRQLSEVGETRRTTHRRQERNPTWAGTDLVYQSNRAGSWDIFRLDSAAQRVGELQWTSAPENQTSPSVHPETGRLLFVSTPKTLFPPGVPRDGDISVCDDDPTQAQVIAQGFQPRWSPDGRHVVFTSRRTGNSDIWVVSAQGGEPRQLTDERSNEEAACFSPDGNRIAYASNQNGQWDIWVMNADGSGRRPVTSYVKDERWPFWAANGKIYFVMVHGANAMNIYAVPEP